MCLSGPSGAGKTLLLRAIADLDAHEGEVFLDGVECRSVNAALWRREVALLPAESQWWYDTVGEHYQDDVDLDLLARLGFGREALQWQVSRLSSGERQRLALLRLLSLSPKVLLLDEPTASLDPENVQRVEDIITHMRRERQVAVLWVSHDPYQAQRLAARRSFLANGSLKEECEPPCVSLP